MQLISFLSFLLVVVNFKPLPVQLSTDATEAPSYVRYHAPGCPQVTTVQLVFM